MTDSTDTEKPENRTGAGGSAGAALLAGHMVGLRASALQGIANSVCQHCPPEYEIRLCMEDGCASVELWYIEASMDSRIDLPDSADKELLEQLNDALCVANGWSC